MARYRAAGPSAEDRCRLGSHTPPWADCPAVPGASPGRIPGPGRAAPRSAGHIWGQGSDAESLIWWWGVSCSETKGVHADIWRQALGRGPRTGWGLTDTAAPSPLRAYPSLSGCMMESAGPPDTTAWDDMRPGLAGAGGQWSVAEAGRVRAVGVQRMLGVERGWITAPRRAGARRSPVDGSGGPMRVVCVCPARSSTAATRACTGCTQVFSSGRLRQISVRAAWADAPILTIHSMKMMMR